MSDAPEVTLCQDEEERFKQRQASDVTKPVIAGYSLRLILGSGERTGLPVALKIIRQHESGRGLAQSLQFPLMIANKVASSLDKVGQHAGGVPVNPGGAKVSGQCSWKISSK